MIITISFTDGDDRVYEDAHVQLSSGFAIVTTKDNETFAYPAVQIAQVHVTAQKPAE